MKFDSKEQFEQGIKDKLSDLCSKTTWASEDLLSLKEYLHPINNHITYLMGEMFLAQLNTSTSEANFKYPEMNNNGYDLAFKLNRIDAWIIAEIKGNIPCCSNKTRYGAKQKEKIKIDIENLEKNKSTSQITDEQFKDAYKFLVLLKNNEHAIKNLIDSDGLKEYKFDICESNSINLTELNKDTIYIVLIDL